MIPDLLWRCPLCATNDALVHRTARLCADTVSCTACGARWRVRRAVGDDFYLKLTYRGSAHAAPGISLPPVGDERRLAAWYDLMKQTLCLEPLARAGLPVTLAKGENLYLMSGEAEIWAARPDCPQRGGAGVPFESECLSQGNLYLTSQRFGWQGDDRQMDFPLRQMNGVFAIINFTLALVVGQQLYQVLFAGESPLKWVSYAALLAPQVAQAENGHLLRTSHH